MPSCSRCVTGTVLSKPMVFRVSPSEVLFPVGSNWFQIWLMVGLRPMPRGSQAPVGFVAETVQPVLRGPFAGIEVVLHEVAVGIRELDDSLLE